MNTVLAAVAGRDVQVAARQCMGLVCQWSYRMAGDFDDEALSGMNDHGCWP